MKTIGTEPILIKAGDPILGLGLNKVPPKEDCRVISETNYQIMKTIVESYEEIVKIIES